MSIANLVIIFLAACMLSVFYWHVIQPVALKWSLFRLFACRDELRRLAIEGKEDYMSWPYRELETLICKTIAVVPAFSLGSFLLFIFRNDTSTAQAKFVDRFHKEASTELVRLMHRSLKTAGTIMMANSPFITIFFFIGTFALWLSDKLNRQTLYRKGEAFIETLPEAA